jgi:hypothetical protein
MTDCASPTERCLLLIESSCEEIFTESTTLNLNRTEPMVGEGARRAEGRGEGEAGGTRGLSADTKLAESRGVFVGHLHTAHVGEMDPAPKIEIREHGLVVSHRLPGRDVSDLCGAWRWEGVWEGEIATAL